jgi:hypothetical protein
MFLWRPSDETEACTHYRSRSAHSIGVLTMRKLVSTFSFLVLAGCSGGHPISYFALTPQPSPDAYTCALRKVNELGYTITNTSKDAGFLTADKQTTGTMHKLLTNGEVHDQLTVSVFDDAATQQRKVRVTAGTTEAKSGLLGGTSTSAQSPSDSGIADANSVLSACATGPITKQSSATWSARVAVALSN